MAARWPLAALVVVLAAALGCGTGSYGHPYGGYGYDPYDRGGLSRREQR